MAAQTFLVTGATGCIGRAVVAAALARGWRVRGLARCSPALRLDAELVLGDIRDPLVVGRAATGCDAIIHAAGWVHRLPCSDADRFDLRSSIIDGSRVVAEAAARTGARLVSTSSVAVLDPVTDYARAKLEAEHSVLTSCPRAVIIRPTVVYGPHDRGNVAALIDAIERRRAVIVGSGTNRKSMVYSANLADRLLAAAQRDDLVGTWCAADDPAPTQAEILASIARALGLRPPPRIPRVAVAWGARVLDALGRTDRWSGRVTKLSSESVASGAPLDVALGYSPQVSWSAGILSAVAWHLGPDNSHAA